MSENYNITMAIRQKVPIQMDGVQSMVCDNADYTLTLEPDGDWDGYDTKTVLFILPRGAGTVSVLTEGNVCKIPVIKQPGTLRIGVTAGGELRTSREMEIPVLRSIRTIAGEEAEQVPPDLAQQLIERQDKLEKKFETAGGNSILYTPQELTEAEQAQARENIGAARKPLHIQAEFIEGNTAIRITEYTLEDLQAHCASGEVIVYADSEADGYMFLIGRLMDDMIEGTLYTLADDQEKPLVGRRVVVAGFEADPAALTLVGQLMYTDAPVEVDSTLSVAGAAADAAAAGGKPLVIPAVLVVDGTVGLKISDYTTDQIFALSEKQNVTIMAIDDAGNAFVGTVAGGLVHGTFYITDGDLIHARECLVTSLHDTADGYAVGNLTLLEPLSAAETTAIAEEAAALVDAALLPLIGEVQHEY